MWCAVCQHEIAECNCPDIVERLRSLYSCPMAIAAAQNVAMRELLQSLKDEIPDNA